MLAAIKKTLFRTTRPKRKETVGLRIELKVMIRVRKNNFIALHGN